MKRFPLAVAAFMIPAGFIGLTASAQEFTPAPQDKAPAGTVLPDRYIVELKAGENPVEVAAVHGVATRHVYRKAVNGFAGFVPPGRLDALKADPRVIRVTPDRVISAIGKPSGGGGTPMGQVVPEGVKRIGAAPGGLSYKGTDVGVAVVDTGVDIGHQDLSGTRDAHSAFGGSAKDDNGHGTHVAGIIAARDNGVDVVGVAPEATIYAVKVLAANGSGSDADVMDGLEWVASHAATSVPPIRVVNMSLGRVGTLDDNPSLHDAVKALVSGGVSVVVAAGNDASLEVKDQVPATYPEVIAVASTTAKTGKTASRVYNFTIPADTASYFTSDGKYNTLTGIGVSVSAPGEDEEDITKAGFLQSVGILSTRLGGGTTRMSGTSMAAPHVTGVVALLNNKNTGLSHDVVWGAITGSASRIDTAPLDSPARSYSYDGEKEGILNAPGALLAVP